MKVAMIGTAHPYRGGLAAYNERLVRELQSMGHEATLYTFTLQYPNMLFPGKTQYSSAPAPQDIRIVRCLNSVNPFNWRIVGKMIQVEEPDLILTKYWLPFMGPALGTAIRNARRHGQPTALAIADNIIPHEHRPGDTVFTRYFLRQVDGVIGMTDSVLEDLDKFDAQKPRILSPHPIFDNFGDAINRDRALNKLELDTNHRYLLFFGFIREYKGLDLLLEALALLKDQQGLRLIIAGEFYDNRARYMDLIGRLQLRDRIHLFDQFIPDSEVATYFSAADLVVQPYKSATQSGVTQIAYQFEKPMIVTNVGGLPEMCPDGRVGYVVPPDPDAIAKAIVRFFEKTDGDAMQRHIAEEKKKYSWATLADNILKLADAIGTDSGLKQAI